MPEPKEKETHDEFMSRCMSSEEAQRTFPDMKQRFAFCESQWSKKDGKRACGCADSAE